MDRQIIESSQAPAAIGPYAQANRVGDLIFTSGQLPIDPATGEFGATTIAGQTEQSILNLKAVLEEAGSSLADVIKTTVLLDDINDFAAMNEVYARYFAGDALPSRSAFAVDTLPKRALVEIEAIAMVRA
ncbi:MAG: RidA family protein [Coriobacteriales bacterium]|jgi:2-iminobutanoate/2-iminopropanoate deaminase|nr:RidA family protein [Coriobacteriales bacterium]